jgi:hypothetical protein
MGASADSPAPASAAFFVSSLRVALKRSFAALPPPAPQHPQTQALLQSHASLLHACVDAAIRADLLRLAPSCASSALLDGHAKSYRKRCAQRIEKSCIALGFLPASAVSSSSSSATETILAKRPVSFSSFLHQR